MAEDTFLPGLLIDRGLIVVDMKSLKYPGDLLHEMGHIAVMAPDERRRRKGDISKKPADEMATIAWSWAALSHLAIEPEVVFHSSGYRGGSENLISSFKSPADEGDTGGVGVPMLRYYGMTPHLDEIQERGAKPFPHMLHWLR